MSKSYDNSIYLSDRGKELHRKVASMFTDPQRMRKKIRGNPISAMFLHFTESIHPRRPWLKSTRPAGLPGSDALNAKNAGVLY